MRRVEGFSFDGELDLLAVFPVEGVEGAGAGEAVIRISGAVVLPDRVRFTVSLGPGGETIETGGVIVGEDFYMQDPDSGRWYKESPPGGSSGFLDVMQLVGLLYLPNDPAATLGEPVDLGGGTRGYVLVSEQAGQGSGLEGFGFPGGILARVVGADDFLTREVRVAVEGIDGETRDFLVLSYRGYDEPEEIEPPAEYEIIPDDPTGPGTLGAPTVVGFAKNSGGDVEVTFSEPVYVQGEVELYVLDPETGGWGLPFLGGSGTDTLTFDADAEDRPALVEGESQIGGIAFLTADSQIADSDGDWPILDFEPWTYQ